MSITDINHGQCPRCSGKLCCPHCGGPLCALDSVQIYKCADCAAECTAAERDAKPVNYAKFKGAIIRRSPKIMVIGHAQHGKDTVCEMLGLPFQSSSMFALDLFLFDYLRRKYGYETKEAAYAGRYDCRRDWFQQIRAYNTPDAARLGRQILQKYDVYCGCRSIDDLDALRAEKAVDLVIWVDASQIRPPEPPESNQLRRHDADLVISNNGTLIDLRRRVDALRTVMGLNG